MSIIRLYNTVLNWICVLIRRMLEIMVFGFYAIFILFLPLHETCLFGSFHFAGRRIFLFIFLSIQTNLQSFVWHVSYTCISCLKLILFSVIQFKYFSIFLICVLNFFLFYAASLKSCKIVLFKKKTIC